MKKRIIIFVAAIMLLFIACGKQDQEVTAFLKDDTNTENLSMNTANDSIISPSANAGMVQDIELEASTMYYVHISGAVQNPGVYTLIAGSRLYEVIAMAGGFTENASEDYCNQAMLLEDGMQYYIPTNEEAEELSAQGNAIVVSAGDDVPASSYTSDGRLNINLATKEELMTLSGIGETRADAIIAYRDERGGFSSTEELMNVNGIKEGLYQNICESITVQ